MKPTRDSQRTLFLGQHSPMLLLVVCACTLTVLGLLVLFSATQRIEGDAAYYLKRQLMWLGIALSAGTVAVFVNLEKLRQLWPVVLGGTVLGLLLLFVPRLGVEVNGATRWLQIGPLRFQPSEFAKLGLVLVLAHYLSCQYRQRDRLWEGFLLPIGLVGLYAGLIFLQPDFGTAALVGTVGFCLLYLAGSRLVYLLPTVGLGALLFAVAVYLDPVRWRRIVAFLDVEQHRSDASYQLWQSLLAFGSGGWTGLGLGNGRQQHSYLPEAHTDFIFAVVGEELGLLGTLGVVVAFMILFFAVVPHLKNSPNLYQYLLVLGAALFICGQALINLGVVTGLLPTKGMSLPFISAGGSNLVLMFIFMGLIINAFRHWERPAIDKPLTQ